MDKLMIHPDHPCYEVDFCHAYLEDEEKILHGQGYLTIWELCEVVRKLREENEKLKSP